MGRHFFLILGILAVLMMAAAGLWKLTLGTPKVDKPSAAARATTVSVTAVQAHGFVDRIDVLGAVKGLQSVTITSSTAELVSAVRFKDGDRVTKNQVLVELKAGREEAGIAQAKATASQALANDRRWRSLADQGVAPKATADQYHTAYLQAEAAVASAESQKLDRVIRAPFAGVVGLTDIAPGSLISAGTPIVSLDVLDHVRVDFDVPDRYLDVLKEGGAMVARMDAYPDRPVTGKIAKIDSRVDPTTRSIKVRAILPNTDGRLKPGMLAKVVLENGARQSPAVPESAIQIEADQPAVFVLANRGGKVIVRQRPIVMGSRDGGLVEVKAGLKIGKSIVADGVNRLQDGRPVKPVSSGGASNKKHGPGPLAPDHRAKTAP